MGRLKRRIKQLVLLEHRLQEKTIQHLAVPGIEHDEDAVKKVSTLNINEPDYSQKYN